MHSFRPTNRALLWAMLALAFSSLTILAAANSTTNDTLKLGVLAPTSGPNESLGNQIIVGVQLAIDQMDNSSTIVIAPNWNGTDIEQGLAELEKMQVHIIIAGIADSQVEQFTEVMSTWSSQSKAIPIVVLARNQDPEKIAAFKQFKHLISFGYTFHDYTQAALSTWAQYLNIGEPIVVYDQGFDYFEELRELSEDALSKHTQVRSLPFDKLDTALNGEIKSDGFVLVGQPTEIIKWTETIKRKDKDTPIFLPGMYLSSPLIEAGYYDLPHVYHGSIWGSHPGLKEDAPIFEFEAKVAQRLGWQTDIFSALAWDAYGAVKVVEAAWRAWNREGLPSSGPDPWKVLLEKQSLKTVADFIVGYPGGVKTIVKPGYLAEATGSDWVPFVTEAEHPQ